jgi:hypothetical protein
MELRITALDADILRALSQFIYCTIPQLTRIVGAKNENSVKNALQRLRGFSRPLVKKWEYAFIAGVGRLHSISTLTQAGVNILAEVDRVDPDSIYFPALGVQYSRDYLHRRAFVDCHISIEQWAATSGATIEFFDRYFLANGGNHSSAQDSLVRREYETRVVLPSGGVMIPDGLFCFEQSGNKRLCVLELHQGRETKKIMEQLEKHVRAIESAAIRKKYGLEDANFVLSVYEHRETMQAVMKRFMALPEYGSIRLAFHFATVEDVAANLLQAWQLASGEKVSLFR